MFKKKIVIAGIIIVILSITIIMINTPERIKASEVIDLVQSNYESITVNDKHIETGTSNQYLIDDFIPKLSRYTMKAYDGDLPNDYKYKVVIKGKDGTEITLLDNDYLIKDNKKYEILKGTINLDKFYNIFMD